MADTWPEGSEGRLIEEGLMILLKFVGIYLIDANSKVNDCNDTLRDAITAG